MAETHQVVTKVWIAPGCIVCDSCENDCPEVFEVQEATCIIRPPAMNADFLKPITQSIITAMEGCPVEVIKIETVEVAGPAWADLPAGEPVAGSRWRSGRPGTGRQDRGAHGRARSQVAGASLQQQNQPIALRGPRDDDS